jgi:hypothetical protein
VEGHHWRDVLLEQRGGMQDDAVTPQAHHKVDVVRKPASASSG